MKKLRVTVEGKVYEVTVQVLEDDESVVSGAGFNGGIPPTLIPPAARRPAPATPAAAPALPTHQPDAILAPIAGTVRKVFVEQGSEVEAHAPVVMLDAMKMDTYIYAPRAFTVTEVAVKPGAAVQVGDCLVRFTPRG